MADLAFPTSQGELIRAARSEATQAEFARELGVNRSSLSRYESEVLGAPAAVISHCLKVVAKRLATEARPGTRLHSALSHARRMVATLEAMAAAEAEPKSEAAPARGTITAKDFSTEKRYKQVRRPGSQRKSRRSAP